jgi:hypothetical protein
MAFWRAGPKAGGGGASPLGNNWIAAYVDTMSPVPDGPGTYATYGFVLNEAPHEVTTDFEVDGATGEWTIHTEGWYDLYVDAAFGVTADASGTVGVSFQPAGEHLWPHLPMAWQDYGGPYIPISPGMTPGAGQAGHFNAPYFVSAFFEADTHFFLKVSHDLSAGSASFGGGTVAIQRRS